MTVVARIVVPNLNAQYSSAAAGTSPAWAAMANGDQFSISSGNGTLLCFRTSGTAITVTLTNVIAPPYGTGGNITVTLGATDEQWVFIEADGTNRFDRLSVLSADSGLMNVTYSVLTGGTRAAVTIP